MENETPDDDTGPESRTLASLKKKKAALALMRREYFAKIKGLERDMATLDAAMRVFDPRSWAGRQVADKQARKRQHIAGRFLLDFLREAGKPVLAGDITKAWIEAQGQEADGRARQIYGQRISNALSNLKRKGMVTSIIEVGKRPLWHLVDQG